METLNEKESETKPNKKLQNFLTKMSKPIVRKDRDEIKMKYYNKPPHPSIHNHHTIKWLRQRVNENTIEKSVKSLLPNNGECLVEEDKTSQKYKLKQFLKEYYKKEDKFSNIQITPKYFFSELIMNKIKKLRDIFLEFDEDGSRKLEIDEMVIMFKTNNIKVVQEDLKTLFFKDDKNLQDDELYLDFYQFMEFALNKQCDQDFRMFMRKLKNKKPANAASGVYNGITNDRRSVFSNDEKSRVGEPSNNNLHYESTQSLIPNKSQDQETLFLPMNFNLLLDYFNNKGKQRLSMTKIQDAIATMTKIIDGGIDHHHEENKDSNNENNNNNFNKKNENILTENNEDNPNYENERELKRQKIAEENFKLHDTLDCRVLLEEFRQLFAQRPTSDYEDNAIAIIEKLFKIDGSKSKDHTLSSENKEESNNIFKNISTKKKKQISEIFHLKPKKAELCRDKDNIKDIHADQDSNPNKKTRNFIGIIKSHDSDSNNANPTNSFHITNESNRYKNINNLPTEEMNPEDMVFTNYIKNRMDNKNPTEIGIQNYNKYKSLLLAYEETKKCINNAEASVASFGNTKSTGFSMNNNNNNNTNKRSIYSVSNYKSPSDINGLHPIKDWNVNINNIEDKNKKDKILYNNMKNNYNIANRNYDNNDNDEMNRFSKTVQNYIISNNKKKNNKPKKIKLPDPQYNFNYQAKYFGDSSNLGNKKDEQRYNNFLLPLIKKTELSNRNNGY